MSIHWTIQNNFKFQFRASSDCYQWFTGISGDVKSLNFAGVPPADTVYSICVRQEIGYCGIEWSQAATTSPDSFDLDATLTVGVAVS